jgi:hypothetical protein
MQQNFTLMTALARGEQAATRTTTGRTATAAAAVNGVGYTRGPGAGDTGRTAEPLHRTLPTLAMPGLSPAVMAGLAAVAAQRAKHAAIGSGIRQTRTALTNAAATTARKTLGGY